MMLCCRKHPPDVRSAVGDRMSDTKSDKVELVARVAELVVRVAELVVRVAKLVVPSR